MLEAKLFESPVHDSPDIAELYELFDTKVKLGLKIKGLKQSISAAESILQLDELKARRRVLRRLGYTSDADVIQMKGRVACEISAGDELLLTEMIFNGVFNDLTLEQTVALLSCFVCSERVSDSHHRVKETYLTCEKNRAIQQRRMMFEKSAKGPSESSTSPHVALSKSVKNLNSHSRKMSTSPPSVPK
jgi:superfamily II RNA helicase